MSLKNKYILFLIFIPFYILFCDKVKDKEIEEAYAEEKLIHESKSKYSHFKIKDYGSLRTLYFVRDNGDEVVESTMDVDSPGVLFLLYTQVMFSSFLHTENREDILLAGVGGGSMVRFINHHFPNIKLDAVEIDKEIIDSARKYFNLKENKNTKIINYDIFEFLENSKKKYNIIMMDAFLKPTDKTDPTGISNKQKENKFFLSLKNNLKPKGSVVFNLNIYGGYLKDIKLIKENFPKVTIYKKNTSGNIIVVAEKESLNVSKEILMKRAESIDQKISANFKFKDLLNLEKDLNGLGKK